MPLPRADTPDALLLDLDDTILDDRSGVEPSWRIVVSFVCEARPELEPGAVRRAIGEATSWFWSDPERERRGRLDLERVRGEILAGVLAELGAPDGELAAAAAREYTRVREESYRIASGARTALERLRRGLPRLALVTNGASRPQRAKIERFSLAGYFDHIQVEGEFGLGKPEPEVFRHTAAAVGAIPEHCLMVGDSYRNDVLGALGAGMHAVWLDVEGLGAPPSKPPRPHATLHTLAELADTLGI